MYSTNKTESSFWSQLLDKVTINGVLERIGRVLGGNWKDQQKRGLINFGHLL